MIAQALHAELLKLARNRWSTFWAYGFAPVFTVVSGIIVQAVIRLPAGAEMFNVAAPVSAVRDGLSSYSNLFLQIFPIAGAAILFAGEYRWETWRAILTRNGRTSIMLAKLIAFMMAATLSILACGIAGLLLGLIDAAQATNIVWPPASTGDVALALALSFAGSFLQIMATAGLVMLIAVFGRAMIAAIVGPFIILTVAEIASIRFRLPDMGTWGALFPNLAADAIQQISRGILANPNDAMEQITRGMFGDAGAYARTILAPGTAALILWALLLPTAAILLFQRQNLSKE